MDTNDEFVDDIECDAKNEAQKKFSVEWNLMLLSVISGIKLVMGVKIFKTYVAPAQPSSAMNI